MSESANPPTPVGPRRRRGLRWTVGVLAILGLAVWFLPAFLSATWMRGTVRSWMNRDPDHRIDFADLDLSWGHGLRLENLSVHDLKGGGSEPFFTAKSVALDVQWRPLLKRQIVVDDFTVSGATLDMSHNSPGTPPPPATDPPGDGTFGLSSVRVPVTVVDALVRFPKGDVRIDKATMLVQMQGGVMVIDPIDADVNGGKVTGTARVGLGAESPSHALDLHGKGIVLDEYLAPVGAMVFPILAGDPKDGKTSGKADLDISLQAAGDKLDEIKRTVRGDGTAALTGLSLEAKTWLTQAAKAAGRDVDRLDLEPTHVVFHLGDGRVLIDETEARSKDVLVKMGGAVTLDGEMDCKLRVKPTGAVAAFDKYAKWLDPEGYLPLRMTGNLLSPSVGLPDVSDLLQNAVKSGGLEDKAREAIEGLLQGKDKKPKRK